MEFLNNFVLKLWNKNMQPVSIMTFVVLVELIKGMYTISWDNYFDVDFTSYTEQSSQFLDGERDLSKITGKNGPWLYPALHIYTFAGIYLLVGVETFIRYAQLINLAIHIITCIFTVKIYAKAFGNTSKDTWLVALICLNTKIITNSIRIWYAEEYNIMLVFIAIYCFQKSWNFLGICFISIAMGFKMSILLFIPAVYYVLSITQGILLGTIYIALIFMVQEAWAIPFTEEYGDEYRTNAFKFDRNFSINGSVNYHWILYSPLFHSNPFKTVTIIIQVILLLYLLISRWMPLLNQNGNFELRSIFKGLGIFPPKFICSYNKQSQYLIAEVLFGVNFIGVVCSRTLHQQFIVWFWYSLPLLMYAPITQGHISLRKVVLLMLTLNFSFSVVPSIPLSFIAFLTISWFAFLFLRSKYPENRKEYDLLRN